MRRYLPTILLLIALLAVGGLAIGRAFGEPPVTRGPYVPTLSDDPATAQLQALLFVGGLFAILALTIGLGVFLAVSFVRFTRMLNTYSAAGTAEAGSGRPSGPKAPAKSEDLGIPLSSDRSAAIFWIVVVLVVVGFQLLRYWGQPLGYLPSLGEMVNMPLFRLPGEHIEGLPPFIAGPGDEVTALHIFIAVLGGVLVSTAIAGFILARGVARLGHTVQHADQLPPTLPDRLLPTMEQRLGQLRQPRPRRLPGNPIDTFLIALNVLLLLVIAGIVAVFVVPSYGGIVAVDQAVEATRMAALVTATPQGGGTEGNGEGQSPVAALAAEFEALPAGDTGGGQQAFSAAGCVACHSLEPNTTIVGPSLNGLSTRAGAARPDYSAELYIYESIVNPNAHVAEGFQAGIMPQTFKQTLSEQQLADLVAFLMTQ